jgi:predicted DNA-binding transcriptional regulator YafY
MLTADELEAAVLGAQWVEGHGDPGLARAAQDLIAKIAAAVPAHLRPLLLDASTRAVSGWNVIPPDRLDAGIARAWIRSGRKMSIAYRDAEERETERVIWPIAIGYLNSARLLIGWCELRKDFRHFRLDRVSDAKFLDEKFPERPAVLRAKWLKTLDAPC